MKARSTARGLAAAGAVAMVAAGVLAPTAGAAPRAKVIGGKPAWTTGATPLAHAAHGIKLDVRVFLAPRGGIDALQSAVAAVSTPGSPSYHQFITPAQYRAAFEPTDAAVAQVSAWLQSSHLTVTGVEASHRYIEVTGKSGALGRALGTTFDVYKHDGVKVLAPTSAITVPAALGASVLGVTGLDTTPHVVTPANVKPGKAPGGFRNARPCSQFFGQILANVAADLVTPLPQFMGAFQYYAPCGYTGPQLRSAYAGSTDLDGSGVTVAITDAFAAPPILSDANTYATRRGDQPFAAGQFEQRNAGNYRKQRLCGPSGWYGEETLDVEAVHSMAPGANVIYYGSRSCLDQDLTDTLAQVVDDNSASIVTDSWGGPETSDPAQNAADEPIFMQAAMQGISFLFSSGDDGDFGAATGTVQDGYPASSPNVTAVGGTSAAIDQQGNLAWQTGWGTTKYALSADHQSWVETVPFLYGAGGGYSLVFNRPAYQNGVVPAHPIGRAVPDIGLDADPNTGMLVGETQRFPDGKYYDEYRIGGTSVASPLMAGEQALADQHAGSRLGFLNPFIYSHAGSSLFTDVKPVHSNDGVVRVDFANGVDASAGLVYSLRQFNHDSSLVVTPGWDDVTGVGSPDNAYLTAQGG